MVCLAYNLKRLQVLLGGMLPSVALAQAAQAQAVVRRCGRALRCVGRLFGALAAQWGVIVWPAPRTVTRTPAAPFYFSPTGC